MGWTIATLAYGSPPQKVYENSKDITNWHCSQAFLADEEDQRLQAEEALTLENLEQILIEVNKDNDPAFLMRGKPVNQNEDGSYNLGSDCWIDIASTQHQLDLDFEAPNLTPTDDLLRRSDVVLDYLPFLKGVKRLETFSSGAGLPKIGNKNYPNRISMRLWIETDRPYSGEELSHYYQPWINEGLIDAAMFEPTRRHYILHPKLIKTPCGLNPTLPWIRLQKGVAFSPKSLKRPFSPAFSPNKLEKKQKTRSFKTDNTQKKKINQVKKVISQTARDCLPEKLDELAKNGGLDGIRNDIFPWLFKREALFNGGDTALLVAEIMENEYARGDRDRKGLNSIGAWAAKKILAKLRRDAQSYALKNSSEVITFDQINLANCDWSDLKNKRAVAVKSGCGTNKTKGVIFDLVKDAKKENMSVLILSPLIAVTEAIAEACEIRHYHSLGTKGHQKAEVMLNSHYLATCYQSLHYYEKLGEIPEFDIVILDEASQIFRGQGDPKTCAHWVDWVYKICDKSKHIYAFDADIDEHTVWCLEQIENHKPEDFSLYLNHADYGKDYDIHQFDDYGTILAELIANINKGKKVAVALDFSERNGTLTAFQKFLEANCPNHNFRGYDSKTVNRDARELKTAPNETISSWLKDGLSCLTISPWAAVGWDYLNEEATFDEVYVITINQFITAQKLWQWFRRFRLSRSVKLFNRSKTDAPFDAAVMRVIEDEKAKKEANLTRLEAWQVKTKEANDLDLANVNWYFRDLCQERGANLIFRIASDAEKEENAVLEDEFKEFRREVKAQLVEAARTENEQRLKILRSFSIYTAYGYKALDDDIEVDPDHFATLKYREERIDEVKADRFCRIIAADEEQRQEYDRKEILEFNVALGKLFDAFWLQIGDAVDLEKFETIAHWYYQSEEPEIRLNFEDINYSEIATVLSRHRFAIKQELPNIGQDAFTEPSRVLRPIVKSLDLGFKTEYEKKPKDRISAKDGYTNLFVYYKKTKEPNYPATRRINEKKAWCLKNCQRKQKEGVLLSEPEKEFLDSRPNAFTIYRKEFVLTHWIQNIKTAFQSHDDRNGKSENHTQFCRCDGCKTTAQRMKTLLNSKNSEKIYDY